MRVAKGLLIAGFLAISGCASVGFDAIRPLQLNEPIFVVIPPNQSLMQDDYAVKVERYLLGSGMRVAVRPALKDVRIEAGGSDSQAVALSSSDGVSGGGAALSKDEDRIVDSFQEMSNTNANYRINTYAWSKTVEVIDLSNQQVLSVFSFSSTSAPEAVNPLSNTLQSMGFRVSERKSSVNQGDSKAANSRTLISGSAQNAPIFTVIPSGDIFGETDFSLRIERLLIRLGLSVVRPPAPRYKVRSAALAQAAEQSDVSGTSAVAGSARRVESFWALDDTAASVILETNSYGNKVKIIDKHSKEVRSVISMPAGPEATSVTRLRDALVSVGIPVQFEPPRKNATSSSGTNGAAVRK